MPTRHSSISSSESNSKPGKDRSPLIRFFLIVMGFTTLLLVLPRFYIWDSLCNRALECAVLGKEVAAPFRADLHFEFDGVCGDLPRLGNLPDRCVFRPEKFTTDSLGFRNSPSVPLKDYRHLIFGDSFAYGQGLSDEQTAASLLSQSLATPVFNAAGKTELRFLRSALQELPAIQFVHYFYLERHALHPTELSDWENGYSFREKNRLYRLYTQWKSYNPLEILASRFYRFLVQRGVFYNTQEQVVVEKETPDSGTHLFLKETAHFVKEDLKRTQDEVGFFLGLQDRLRQKNIQLDVVLIPEKFTVYFAQKEDLHLTHLAHALKAVGINTTSVLPIFLEHRADAEERSNSLYWRDDTHWAPRGIRLAMDALKYGS